MARLFITHSAICLPELVGTYHKFNVSPQIQCTAQSWVTGDWITYTTSIRAHEIDCFSAAVIRRAGTSTRTGAKDLPDTTGPSRDNLLRAADRDRLASSRRSARGWDRRRRVPSKARCVGATTLKGRRAGTLVGHSSAGAVRGPPAVTAGSVGTSRLGAALDVRRVRGTSARDGDSARGTAGCRSHTNAGYTAGAIAGFIERAEGSRGEGGKKESLEMHFEQGK